MLYEMLANKIPFFHQNKTDLGIMIRSYDPPPIKNVDPQAWEIITGLLNKKPE
jgi:hypothetical protein